METGSATSQRTAAVSAKAPSAARLTQVGYGVERYLLHDLALPIANASDYTALYLSIYSILGDMRLWLGDPV